MNINVTTIMQFNKVLKICLNKVKVRTFFLQYLKNISGAVFDKDMEYPVITFLGTGSARPSLKRGTSAILLEMRWVIYCVALQN